MVDGTEPRRSSGPRRTTEADPRADQRTEDEDEEQRERYREILEEFRTILPGVQVLLGFLLTVPFAPRFEDLDDLGRDLFMVAIVSTAAAIVLFLTPTAFHRIAPQVERDERVRIAVRAAIAGMAAVATSVVTAVFVVTRFIYADSLAAIVAGLIAGLALLLWLVLPLSRRIRASSR